MAYDPTKDFLGLWRNSGSNVSKLEVPGLDYMIAALARAGILNVSVSATQPVANQATTAWLAAAVPSSSAEGSFKLWNATTSAYAAATPALFLAFLRASAGASGASWWSCIGLPSNIIGNDGDFIIRTDSPGGIYGPKAAGAWPASYVPGTADVVSSTSLDNAFGTLKGSMLFRNTTAWQTRTIGADNTMLVSQGNVPVWADISAMLDTVFGSAQGSILYRSAAAWNDLPPGTAGYILATNGPGSDPSWGPRSAEFSSGTVMLFQQTTAPTGWTKQTTYNDVGLRVTSGTVGSGGATAFSTVFAQTATGSYTLTLADIPSHTHSISNLQTVAGSGPGAGVGGGGGFGPPISPSATFSINSNGGGGAHSHAVSLQLAYVDVILASKN